MTRTAPGPPIERGPIPCKRNLPWMTRRQKRIGSPVSDLPEIMSEDEVSRFTGIPARSLSQDRYLKQGIPYVKFGHRVRYLRDDVIAYMLANRVEPENKKNYNRHARIHTGTRA